ncbi:D-alanyl-D-alanine carboxypeptidase family protein [Acidimangrovimonas sediminis]|uniref:D-alanyl-D-alanine carboxypeptidase family protein n=1 Tax=Acidimangrovimonas sediminis TaxID=2056283 RepID=UPI001E2D39A6|nr:D-alanyl-D-alanine carboxypeptidase family protein [Acidimangrovimonas sediminis]
MLWAAGAKAAPYAAYVMDARTGEVLYQKNADARLHPASLTKMLTLYICFDAIERGEISLDTVVTVSKAAASQPPSHLGLRPGQKIKLRYLIRAAAVKSANDAAWAIGDAIAGNVTEFAKRMNATAKKLGMDDSHFENPNGLTLKGHLSSAHDMAIIGRHLFYDFPQFYNIFSRRSTYAGVAEVYSTNRKFLNAYRGADGIKTGYTYASGFNLVASAERGGKRIIAAEFGGTSTAERNAKMAELLDLGFKRAPAHVALQKPKKPNLDRIAALYTAHSSATRIALADDTDSTRVDSSPRPEPRPGAAHSPSPALMAAIQDNISNTLDRVADGATPAPAAETAAETAALAPADSPIKPARRPGAAPVQVAAAALPVERADPVADRTDIGTDGAPDLPPPPRPADLVATATPTAIVPSTDAARASAAAETAAGGGALTVASAATAPIEQVEPTSADAAAPVTASKAPVGKDAKADSGVVFASIAPREVPKPEARPEVVTRMSTSGGRNWGINVGRFPSAFVAEKALLRTALAESSALSDGLRKVVRRPNGFDANFMGLTQDQADLACSRLQARGIQCFSLAP